MILLTVLLQVISGINRGSSCGYNMWAACVLIACAPFVSFWLSHYIFPTKGKLSVLDFWSLFLWKKSYNGVGWLSLGSYQMTHAIYSCSHRCISLNKTSNWRLHQVLFRYHCRSKGSINLWGTITVNIVELVGLGFCPLSYTSLICRCLWLPWFCSGDIIDLAFELTVGKRMRAKKVISRMQSLSASRW